MDHAFVRRGGVLGPTVSAVAAMRPSVGELIAELENKCAIMYATKFSNTILMTGNL